jgi:hypothetical protein
MESAELDLAIPFGSFAETAKDPQNVAHLRVRRLARSLALACAILLIGSLSRKAYAHGGGTIQIADSEVGPYLVTVWTSPPKARVGEALHVTVGVNQELDGIPNPVLDALISVDLLTGDEATLLQSDRATTDQSVNKLLYEADLTIARTGSYLVRVQVTGPEGEGGTVSFPLDVASERQFNWLIIPIISAALLVAVLLFRSWRSGQRDSPGNPVRRRQA